VGPIDQQVKLSRGRSRCQRRPLLCRTPSPKNRKLWIRVWGTNCTQTQPTQPKQKHFRFFDCRQQTPRQTELHKHLDGRGISGTQKSHLRASLAREAYSTPLPENASEIPSNKVKYTNQDNNEASSEAPSLEVTLARMHESLRLETKASEVCADLG
jgi:hypothetical protein